MYNRYIPQTDGSYRRSSVPDAAAQARQSARPTPSRPQNPGSPPPRQESQSPPSQSPPSRQNRRAPRQETRQSDTSAESFLRQLLPKDFCSEDLLVVLLLLLMAGDRREEQGSALLTLALYLFM